MPRERSPNRDKAFEIYKEHKGNITLREIANILNEKEKTVSNWKCRDKWDAKINCSTTKKECSTTKEKKNKKTSKESIAEEVKEVLENTELTDKQRLFCGYYIKCFNATKAYQKAYGCSYEVALVNGSRLLGNAKVSAEVKKLKANKLNRVMLDEDDIFQKYIDIAFADISDYVTFGQKEMPMLNPITGEEIVNEDGEAVTYTINYVNFKESSEVDGTIISEVSKGKDGVKVKLQDKMKALQWLSDRMDLLPTETRQKVKIEEEKLRMAREKLELEKNEANKDENKDNDLAKAILQAMKKRNGGSNE